MLSSLVLVEVFVVLVLCLLFMCLFFSAVVLCYARLGYLFVHLYIDYKAPLRFGMWLTRIAGGVAG